MLFIILKILVPLPNTLCQEISELLYHTICGIKCKKPLPLQVVLATPLQRVSGGGEGLAPDPGLHVQRRAANARVLARPAVGHWLRG